MPGTTARPVCGTPLAGVLLGVLVLFGALAGALAGGTRGGDGVDRVVCYRCTVTSLCVCRV